MTFAFAWCRQSPWARFAPVLAAGLLLVFGGACGKRRTANNAPPVVKIDWNKKWSHVNDEGETGKFHIKQGFGKKQTATTEEALVEAYEEMIKGYKMIMEACKKGDELKSQVEAKDPGSSYPEWEEKLSTWGEEAMKVRKNLPMEFIDQLKD